MEKSREQKIAEAMRSAALAEVLRAREQGESDLRQVRNWIQFIDVDEVIASIDAPPKFSLCGVKLVPGLAHDDCAECAESAEA